MDVRLLPLTVLVLAACGPKVSPEIQATKTDYFPMIEGSSWEYEGTFNGRSSLETHTLIPLKTADGRDVTAFIDQAEVNDNSAGVFTPMFGSGIYWRKGDTVYTQAASWTDEVANARLDAEDLFLTLPPTQVGAEIGNIRDGSPDRSGPILVEAVEDLTVPAGTFRDCAKLKLVKDSRAWLCPGVGLARWEFVTGRVEVLTSYRIGPAEE